MTHDCDVLIVGGGHNGLVCAAYLARRASRSPCSSAGRRRRRGRDRGVSSGLPQFGRRVHGLAAESEGHSRSRSARHGLHDRRARDRRISCRPPTAAISRVGGGQHASGSREVLRSATPSGSMRTPRSLEVIADVLRELVLQTPPNVVEGGWRARAAGNAARRAASAGASPSSTSPQRQELLTLFASSAGDYLDGWFESDPIKAVYRLRRHRRQLCEPLLAGLGLRAAASRVRRGQRQERAPGATRSAAWARSRRRWRNAPRRAAWTFASTRLCARSSSRTARAVGAVTEAGETFRAAAVVSNLNPKLLYLQLLDPAALPAGVSRAHRAHGAAAPARSA